MQSDQSGHMLALIRSSEQRRRPSGPTALLFLKYCGGHTDRTYQGTPIGASPSAPSERNYYTVADTLTATQTYSQA